jgi:hypothetical protein
VAHASQSILEPGRTLRPTPHRPVPTRARLFAIAFRLALAALAGGLLAGCSAIRFPGQNALVASYQPDNVFHAEPSLAPEIRRVALLPLAEAEGDAPTDLEFGRTTLAPLLAAELGRSRRFELVPVSAADLRRLTGLNRWTSGSRFPEDFFDRLRDELGIQAVLLPELTQYRPHEPLAIGWRVKLVDATEPRVLWAIDEVFDARVPSVAAAARRHARGNPETPGSLADEDSVLQSPRRFGRYTASAVVATLPSRTNSRAELKN